MKLLLTLALIALISPAINAEPFTLSSGDKQTILIELYSSEGCSSCPPADQFVSQFVGAEELWSQYIPLVFHVDYWDYLGWKDVFASAAFSERQRKHQRQGNLSSVYTPGFVVNGKEWSGFFKPWRALPEFDNNPGKLKVSIDLNQIFIEFPSATKKLKYNLAIVGMGLITAVKAGENAGNDMQHDFVILNHQTLVGETSVATNLPLIIKHQPKRFAVIAWITNPNSLKPIQAVGGYLPDGTIKSI